MRRQAEAARATEADLERRLADAAAAASKLEAEVAAGRTRAAQLGEELRARERELAALARSLEAQRSAEHSANVVAGKTEEAAKRLDSEAGEVGTDGIRVTYPLTRAWSAIRVSSTEVSRVLCKWGQGNDIDLCARPCSYVASSVAAPAAGAGGGPVARA